MNQDSEILADQRGALKLKLPEPDVDAKDPWRDDVLKRKEVASRLTNMIRNQSLPFVISIHGEWGTGKTFMLKRWQRDLEIQGFKAIYFNAWEDDFCDDPLLAIIGQLWSYFEKDKEGRFEGFLKKIRKNAGPLIRANFNSLARKYIGVTGEVGPSKQDGRDLVDEYLHQTSTKDTLKKSLGSMVEAVVEETGHPLIFIIDELDRCRPTFAIELLERVKHLFDVPNMVFVLGINRDELCKSLQSVYGEIDADVYLRRFFDMEFNLAEVDTQEFGRYLMRKFELGDFFASLVRSPWDNSHASEFQALSGYFPALWYRLHLSLRDIDHCVRSIALVGKNLQTNQFIHAFLLGLLITLKLKNVTLYRRFVQGDSLGSEVMDYIYGELPSQEMDRQLQHSLNMMEVYLYLSDKRLALSSRPESTALAQLKLLQDGKEPTYKRYLSKRTRQASREKAGKLIELIELAERDVYSVDICGDLANLIDLYQGWVRR